MADFIQVNLLPIEYRVVRKDYSWLLDWRLLLSVVMIVSAGAGYLVASGFFEANLESKRQELAQVEADISRNQSVLEQIKTRERLKDEMIAKNRSLKSISVSKRRWVRILEDVNKALPINMWVESVLQEDQNEYALLLKGRTYVFPEVAQYMLELEKSEYFQKVTLSSIELQEQAEAGSFLFTLQVQLDPSAGVDQLGNEGTL